MPEFQEPDGECNPPAKVYLDGQRVPIIEDGARVEWRKEGPLSQQFVADVYVPLEDSYGQDWTDVYMDAQYGICDIEVLHWGKEAHASEASGIVAGIGSGQSGPLEARLRVVDPALLMKEFPVQKQDRFTKQTSLKTVLERLATSFEERNPTYDSIPLVLSDGIEITPADSDEVADDGTDQAAGGGVMQIYEDYVEPALNTVFDDAVTTNEEESQEPDKVLINKNFETYTKSLADVAAYVENIANIRLRFGPPESTNQSSRRLVIEPPQQQYAYKPKHNDGTLDLLENDLLAEINPINTLEVVGGRTVVNTDSDGSDGGQFSQSGGLVSSTDRVRTNLESVKAIAKVRHEPTYEIAGQEVTTQVEKAEIREVGQLVNAAKQELKQRMDQAGHGNATFTLSPYLSPYDILQLPFQCSSDTVFQYEIERLTHHAGPTQRGENGLARTEVQCSFATRDEDITVVNSGTKEI
ncbi:hypothetical protein BV210_00150 [Halorientalis sp. IM1011]|uniref:hypothetical protein n=1 Tax=Halorientalis sp. IM1011 TaxID=1932360 RepID=UPI00097CC3E4|nr:hypothetical protein [Halorientalis sp. IM1011]AQL41216.1 hypothetical protein BV210_00150 [Halorientalis sp. IM1011]